MTGATTTLAVVLVLTGCLLAGCGQNNPYALPDYDGSTGSAVVEPRPDPAARSAGEARVASRVAKPPPEVRYRPADAWGEGAWVERGTVVARTPEQLAVVDAVTEYMSERVQLSNTWQVDERALTAVASGQAAASARKRAARQRDWAQRSVGRFILNVSSVQVSGTYAAVTGCHFDSTSEVDKHGNVMIAPPGGVLITMELRKTAGTWRVVEWPDHPVPFCDWRRN